MSSLNTTFPRIRESMDVSHISRRVVVFRHKYIYFLFQTKKSTGHCNSSQTCQCSVLSSSGRRYRLRQN